jgi:hypothetical protein
MKIKSPARGPGFGFFLYLAAGFLALRFPK